MENANAQEIAHAACSNNFDVVAYAGTKALEGALRILMTEEDDGAIEDVLQALTTRSDLPPLVRMSYARRYNSL